jgi:hypothetical protein
LRETERKIYFCVFSGSLSGVSVCSVFVGGDVVPGTSEGSFSSMFSVRQSYLTALNVCNVNLSK